MKFDYKFKSEGKNIVVWFYYRLNLGLVNVCFYWIEVYKITYIMIHKCSITQKQYL